MSILQPMAAKMHVKENCQPSAGENKSPWRLNCQNITD
jgi:hypothetical protein